MGKMHTVKQGESLAAIAKKHGFSNWRTIYDHPDNAEFREKRPNPNILYPGDKVVIPEKGTKIESGVTEQRHHFRVKREAHWLRIKLIDTDDKAIANTPYRLDLGSKVIKKKTDSEGLLETEIPPDTEQCLLVIKNRKILLKIGCLNPLDTITGWQSRLKNLGYYAGIVHGQEDYWTHLAVEEFQCDYGLKEHGIRGAKTTAKLKEVYGC